MNLYHGSNVIVEQIDLAMCHRFKDFGRGFYLTTFEEQACDMAARTTRIAASGSPVVMCYEFDEATLANLTYKKFDVVSDEWAAMIINNRNRKFTNFADPLSNHDNKYDVVSGPVANDNISRIFALYVQEIIRAEQLKDELERKKLNNQFSFHTEKALQFLTLLEVTHYG
ncbi:hypothetical protein SAMD00024442_17_51 [Candidatus Symbiothrix dinenymphae]|nr:hypothetical protein SAMD00024442_17_51 [Candidatus Symbiothrix dinenymphae]